MYVPAYKLLISSFADVNPFGPDQLNVKTDDCKILLTEAPRNPTENRRKFCEYMFEKYEFQSMYIQIQAVLTLYAQGLAFLPSPLVVALFGVTPALVALVLAGLLARRPELRDDGVRSAEPADRALRAVGVRSCLRTLEDIFFPARSLASWRSTTNPTSSLGAAAQRRITVKLPPSGGGSSRYCGLVVQLSFFGQPPALVASHLPHTERESGGMAAAERFACGR